MDPAIQIIQLKAQELRARSTGADFPPVPPVPMLEGLE
jgi:hypothetical protein